MGHDKKFDEQSVQAPGAKWNGPIFTFLGIGLALAIGAFIMQGNKAHFLHSYLVAFMLFLSISLGALGFVMINHLVRAGWSVTIRRVIECFMKNLALMAILFIPIAMNVDTMYAWADSRDAATLISELHIVDHSVHGDHADEVHEDSHGSEKVAHAADTKEDHSGHDHAEGEHDAHAHAEDAHADHSADSHDAHAHGELTVGRLDLAHGKHQHHLARVLGIKQVYLEKSFFNYRAIFYFVVWIALAFFMFNKSVSQDTTKDPKTTILMGKASAPGMMLFGLTLSFAAIDWMMSLDYAWFSTIYGVIYFSGAIMCMLGSTIIAVRVLQAKGYMQGVVDQEHYHDMGKFMWAFMIFWTYTSLSQFLIIWYADLPEETIWFLDRMKKGWGPVSYAIIFAHFIIPFAFFMSRHMKRNRNICTFMAAWLIAAEFVWLYWQIMPTVSFPVVAPFHPGITDAMILLGMAGIYIAGFLFNLKNNKLIPVGDPRLNEAVNFKNF